MNDSATEEALVRSILSAFEAKDSERLLALCTPDVIFEFPFLGLRVAPDELDRKVMSTLALMNDLTFSDITVEAMARSGWHLARYRGQATVSTTGKQYRQTYITLVGSRDGRMTHFLEHFDTATFMAAMRPDRPDRPA
ncbi:nuclear transport factor 2 family protein [Spirillospora sp. CA-255316]